jgi:hypothetical protein
MSFLRHREIYPSDGSVSVAANAPSHRLDEFPAGYSSAGWSPPEPASASPAGNQYAVKSSCRSRFLQRTANCVLTVCLTPGDHRSAMLEHEPRTSQETSRTQPLRAAETAAVGAPAQNRPSAGLAGAYRAGLRRRAKQSNGGPATGRQRSHRRQVARALPPGAARRAER